MSATVFVRNRPGRFSNRVGGYGMSHKIWSCRACRRWHEKKKPLRCAGCEHPDFLHYDSAAEARWFIGLMRLQDQGRIHDLKHHPRYPIHILGPDGVTEVFYYEGDAEYVDESGVLITADMKPKAAKAQDPVFKLKSKCFQAGYGRPVIIVTER